MIVDGGRDNQIVSTETQQSENIDNIVLSSESTESMDVEVKIIETYNSDTLEVETFSSDINSSNQDSKETSIVNDLTDSTINNIIENATKTLETNENAHSGSLSREFTFIDSIPNIKPTVINLQPIEHANNDLTFNNEMSTNVEKHITNTIIENSFDESGSSTTVFIEPSLVNDLDDLDDFLLMADDIEALPEESKFCNTLAYSASTSCGDKELENIEANGTDVPTIVKVISHVHESSKSIENSESSYIAEFEREIPIENTQFLSQSRISTSTISSTTVDHEGYGVIALFFLYSFYIIEFAIKIVFEIVIKPMFYLLAYLPWIPSNFGGMLSNNVTTTVTLRYWTLAIIFLIVGILGYLILRYRVLTRYSRLPENSGQKPRAPFDLHPDAQINDKSDMGDNYSDELMSTFLSSIKIFGYLERPVFHELARHLKKKKIKAGEILYKSEDNNQDFYVVVDGLVQVFHRSNNSSDVLNELNTTEGVFNSAKYYSGGAQVVGNLDMDEIVDINEDNINEDINTPQEYYSHDFDLNGSRQLFNSTAESCDVDGICDSFVPDDNSFSTNSEYGSDSDDSNFKNGQSNNRRNIRFGSNWPGHTLLYVIGKGGTVSSLFSILSVFTDQNTTSSSNPETKRQPKSETFTSNNESNVNSMHTSRSDSSSYVNKLDTTNNNNAVKQNLPILLTSLCENTQVCTSPTDASASENLTATNSAGVVFPELQKDINTPSSDHLVESPDIVLALNASSSVPDVSHIDENIKIENKEPDIALAEPINDLPKRSDILSGHFDSIKPKIKEKKSSVQSNIVVRAATDTTLIYIPAKAFQKLTEKFPNASAHIIHVILTRLQRVTFMTLYKYLGLPKELLKIEKRIGEQASAGLPLSLFHIEEIEELKWRMKDNRFSSQVNKVDTDIIIAHLLNQYSQQDDLPVPSGSVNSHSRQSSTEFQVPGNININKPPRANLAKKQQSFHLDSIRNDRSINWSDNDDSSFDDYKNIRGSFDRFASKKANWGPIITEYKIAEIKEAAWNSLMQMLGVNVISKQAVALDMLKANTVIGSQISQPSNHGKSLSGSIDSIVSSADDSSWDREDTSSNISRPSQITMSSSVMMTREMNKRRKFSSNDLVLLSIDAGTNLINEGTNDDGIYFLISGLLETSVLIHDEPDKRNKKNVNKHNERSHRRDSSTDIRVQKVRTREPTNSASTRESSAYKNSKESNYVGSKSTSASSKTHGYKKNIPNSYSSNYNDYLDENDLAPIDTTYQSRWREPIQDQYTNAGNWLNSGTKKSLYYIRPGGIAGYMSAIVGNQSFVTVKAKTDVLVGFIPKKIVERIVDLNSSILLCLAKRLVSQLSPLVLHIDGALEWGHVNAGQVLFRRNDPSDSVYIVINGRLRSIVDHIKEENEKQSEEETKDSTEPTFEILAEFGKGESVGELEVITDAARSTTVHAIRDTEFAVLPKTFFKHLALKHPEITFTISKMVARRSQLSSERKQVAFNGLKANFNSTVFGINSGSSNTNLRTVAILPVDNMVPIVEFAHLLQKSIKEVGDSCSVLTSDKVISHQGKYAFSRIGRLKLMNWLEEQESCHRLVLFVADTGPTAPWTARCIRQADCVLLVGNGDTDPSVGDYERALIGMQTTARKELVLLHSKIHYVPPGSTERWLKARLWVHAHHHMYMPTLTSNKSAFVSSGSRTMDLHFANDKSLRIPRNTYQHRVLNAQQYKKRDVTSVIDQLPSLKRLKQNLTMGISSSIGAKLSSRNLFGKDVNTPDQYTGIRSDFGRLARRLLSKSIGLVLGGGGARGVAHVGVIKALEENGIPVDMVGGTSIGSFVSGLYARENNLVSVFGRAKALASRMSSVWRQVLDITYPATSLLTGHEFNRGIWKAFGETRIEDCWLSYFAITTNITWSRMEVHQLGYIWRYIRASMSLAGYLPPLCDQGNMLLDGGYVNNLPVDVMKMLGAETIIAVDVGSVDDTSPAQFGDSLSGWLVLLGKIVPFMSGYLKKRYGFIPQMTEIQSRLAYVSSVKKLEEAKSVDGCLYLNPPVQKFGTLQFEKFNDIFEAGYEYGNEVIKQWKKDGTLEQAFGISQEGEVVGKKGSTTKRHKRHASV